MFFNSSVFSKKLHPGHHRRDGILMAYGKGVETGQRDASIMDLAPTVLNLNGFRIPEQMDGEVIGEISSRNRNSTSRMAFTRNQLDRRKTRK